MTAGGQLDLASGFVVMAAIAAFGLLVRSIWRGARRQR